MKAQRRHRSLKAQKTQRKGETTKGGNKHKIKHTEKMKAQRGDERTKDTRKDKSTKRE